MDNNLSYALAMILAKLDALTGIVMQHVVNADEESLKQLYGKLGSIEASALEDYQNQLSLTR